MLLLRYAGVPIKLEQRQFGEVKNLMISCILGERDLTKRSGIRQLGICVGEGTVHPAKDERYSRCLHDGLRSENRVYGKVAIYGKKYKTQTR